MQLIDAPLQGADSSPVGWAENGTLMNGGGYGRHSFGSHKTYTYEWRSTSAPRVAQILKSYQDGTYGRGLIYFLDPSTYSSNLLPARWADPSMALDYNGIPLIYGASPEAVDTPSFEVNGYPIRSAMYDVSGTPTSWTPGYPDSVFIPAPPGYYLFAGAAYTSTGNGGVYATAVTGSDTQVYSTRLAELSTTDSDVVYNAVAPSSNSAGVRIWIGGGTGTVTLSGLTVRAVPSSNTPLNFRQGPWTGGMGHSGCRFTGAPTWVTNNAVMNGGHIGFAASFTEVGDWATG